MYNYKILNIPKKERPRERLKEVGKSNISDIELLSIIIKTGTKNKSSTDLAIEILNKYTLEELKEITLNQLLEIKGIGEVKAIEILSSIELGKRIYLNKNKKLKKLARPQDIYEYTKYMFNGLKQEYFYCLYFNNKKQLIGKKLLFMGTINKSITHPREVFKEAYLLSASSIVCIHNHPSDDPTPSTEDINFTNTLVRLGILQGIPVVDHIIVGDTSFYSFYEHEQI